MGRSSNAGGPCLPCPGFPFLLLLPPPGPQDTIVSVLKGQVQIQIQTPSRKTPLSLREKEYRSPESERNSRILTLPLNGGLTWEVF